MRVVVVVVVLGVASVAYAQEANGPSPLRDQGQGAPTYLSGSRAMQPRVTMTARDVTADGLDQDVARRMVKRHINEVRSCYEIALRANPTLSGRSRVSLAIDKNGKVTTAESHGFESNVDNCIAARAKTWEFPKPRDGRASIVAAVHFGVEGDQPIGHIGEAPEAHMRRDADSGVSVTHGAMKITGKLDARRAAAVMKLQKAYHEYCYATVDLTSSGLPSSTTATMALELDERGAVTSTTVSDLDSEVVACLLARTRHLQFPPPADGKPAGISFQVTFKKKPRPKK